MKNLLSRAFRLFVLTVLPVAGAFANTVSLDPTFNGTGISLQPIPGASAFGNSFAVQPDGKIVIGGHTVVNQSPDKFAVMRLTADGTPDASFGGTGYVLTAINTAPGASRLLIQPDGKILLGGHSFSNETGFNFTLIRYTSDGLPDPTFNNTGFVTANVAGFSADQSFDMALQPDGKIVMVGSSAGLGSPSDVALMRFNPDGSPGTSFNGTGIRTVFLPSSPESANSVVIQPDGKILVGGYLNNGVSLRSLLMRFHADGAFDTSFGSGGGVIGSPAVNGFSLVSTLALQSDGKILAGSGAHIARFAANGALDASFAVNGVADTGAEVNEIQVIGGDKFLIAAKFGANTGLLRFMKDGARDTNFGVNQFVPGNTCYGAEVEVQSDGKFVLAGYCSTNDNVAKFAAFRFRETRTKRFLDFDGDGGTDFSVYRPAVGEWWYQPSWNPQTSAAAQFGASTDRPIPADYTGDGRSDIAFFRPSSGEWFVLRSDNSTFFSFPFGASGDVPVTGDFDGDQVDDPGVFRPSTGEWFILKSTGGVIIKTFGTAGDKLVPSDYDGDFKTDLAIYRPASGEWWIERSSDSSVYAFRFGTADDKPVPGDYTGDNQTDAAFFRPSTGEWFILRSEDGSFYSIPFGTTGDLPAPGNYAGDGRFDPVVFRPSTGAWHVQITGGFYFYRNFGTSGDQPLPNLFVP